MLKKLKINNYRTFEDFELTFDSPLTLLVGRSGSGKSSILDVLDSIRRVIVDDEPVERVFSPDDRRLGTHFSDRMTFKLEFEQDGERSGYRLELLDLSGVGRLVIADEALSLNGIVHWTRTDKNADGAEPLRSESGQVRGATKSTVPMLAVFNNDANAVAFIQQMAGVVVASPNPPVMAAYATNELELPDRKLTNFVAWIRHVSQQAPARFQAIQEVLRSVLPYLDDMHLSKSGDARTLRFRFCGDVSRPDDSGRHDIAFSQMSDGERQLVVLYSLMETIVRSGNLLCIDEADNYIALREVQPWLRALEDAVEEGHGQCILVSHHPEVLNYLPYESFRLLVRDDQGRSRVVPFSSECISDKLLTPAEVMARGWEEP